MALDVLMAPQRRRAADVRKFSLLEILVVVCLLGVLSSIVVVGVSNVTAESASAACATDTKAVETAVVAFKAENGSQADVTKSALLAHADGGPYLTTWPESPGHYEIGLGASGTVLVEPLDATTGLTSTKEGAPGLAGCQGVK